MECGLLAETKSESVVISEMLKICGDNYSVESEEKYEKVRLSDCWSRSLRGRYGL